MWRQSRRLNAQIAERERLPALLVWTAILPGVVLAPFVHVHLNYKLNSIDAHTRAGAVPEHAAR